MLEGMEEVTIGFGNSFDPATGRLGKLRISRSLTYSAIRIKFTRRGGHFYFSL
jgi:hypothetical protein